MTPHTVVHHHVARALWLPTLACLPVGMALLVAEPLLGQSEQPPTPSGAAGPSADSSVAGRSQEAVEAPVINIQELPSPQGGGPLYAIELRDAEVADVFRILAHDYHLNLLVDHGVTGRVTASFSGISLQEALDAMAEMNHLTMTRQGNILKLAPEVVKVVTKTFTLKHVEAATVLSGSDGAPMLDDLLSDHGKALLGAQPNSIMVIDDPDHLAQVEAFLSMVDRRMTSRAFTLKYLSADKLLGETNDSSSEARNTQASGSGDSSGSAQPEAAGGNDY